MVTAKGGAYPSLQSLIAAAKAKPGDIPYASAGVGSSTHLAAEYFAQVAGVKMLHIPYKGSGPAITDVTHLPVLPAAFGPVACAAASTP